MTRRHRPPSAPAGAEVLVGPGRVRRSARRARGRRAAARRARAAPRGRAARRRPRRSATIFSACSGSVIRPTAPVGDAGLADAGGERHLVARLERDRGRARCRRRSTSMRSTPCSLQQYAEPPALLDVPAAVDPVGAGDPHQQRERRPASAAAHGVDRLEQQPGAVLERAAVVVARGGWRAARGTGGAGSRARRGSRRCRSRPRSRASGGVGEGPHDAGDLLGRRARAGSAYPSNGTARGRDRRPAALVRAGPCRTAVPRAVGRGLAAGVGELDADRGALRVHEVDDPAPGLGLLVVPDARVLRARCGPPGTTADASVMTSPKPPVARAPRCTRCQSSGTPSVAEYWHIGASQTRLRAVSDRRVIGSNSFDNGSSWSDVGAHACDNRRGST